MLSPLYACVNRNQWGTVGVKVGTLDGETITASPEYEDCRRAALETGLPLSEVYRAAVRGMGE